MSKWKLMEQTITKSDRIKMASFVLSADQFTNGKKVKEFEKAWSKWLGCKYSLFVSSGSTANFLLVAAIKEKYNLKNGDKVIVPACTWVTNVGPIIQLGLQPIFCDVNMKNYSFDIEHLKEIKKEHKDIKMIFVTHLLGFPAENHLYKEIFPKAIIIDDVCESHGCLDINGNKVGSDSLGATFSFYFGHHMTTVEGGMVSTNDPELYDLMKVKRSHGMARESINYEKYASQYPNIHRSFLFITDGYNFRNHEICAVLGLAQPKRLNKMIKKRQDNYSMFLDIIKQHSDLFYVPKDDAGNSSFCFPIVSYKKEIYNKLIELLEKNNVEHRPIVSGNLLVHPFLKEYKMNKKDSNATTLNNNGVYLGNNHFIGKKELALLEKIMTAIANDKPKGLATKEKE